MGLHRGRLLSLLFAALLVGGTVVACDDDDSEQEASVDDDSEETQADGEGTASDFDKESLPFYATGPVAMVDGEELGEDSFNEMVYERTQQLPGELPPQMVEMFKGQTIDFVIDKHLVDSVLDAEDIEVTDEEIEEAFEEFKARFGGADVLAQQLEQMGVTEEEVRENMHQDVQLEKYLGQRYDLEVDEEDVRQMFEMQREHLGTQDEVHARHILIEVGQDADDSEAEEAQERAQGIYEEAEGGADFEELAREHSEGPTAERGGDLGFFPRHQMVPEFSEVAFEMEPGDISEPVRSQFGYHIIQVVDSREGEEANFENVQDDLELQIRHQKRQEVFQEFLEELKADVEIERLTDNIEVTVEVPEGGGQQGMPAMPHGGGQQGGQPQQQPQGGDLELDSPELELQLND